MSSFPPELYLYWRLCPDDLPAAQKALQCWQRELEGRWPGLQARLLLKADARAEVQADPQRQPAAAAHSATLMETYTRSAGLPPELQAFIVDQGAQATATWRQGPRHVEVFAALSG